ncbi:MAG: ATP-binding cassette domain-containing protein, partial [Erysipelotrichales bacterium]|nr:ATP-binding cassette domain-containing protein [Erysipelotrichales bacterium]
MFRLENVSKTFINADNTTEAVRHVTLEIKDGEIFGIIGLSGAGKSTLVRCLNFLERPTEGKVYFQGEDLSAMEPAKLREARKKMSMIFQDFNLL